MMADKARLPAPLEEAVEFVMLWLEHAPIIETSSPLPQTLPRHNTVTTLPSAMSHGSGFVLLLEVDSLCSPFGQPCGCLSRCARLSSILPLRKHTARIYTAHDPAPPLFVLESRLEPVRSLLSQLASRLPTPAHARWWPRRRDLRCGVSCGTCGPPRTPATAILRGRASYVRSTPGPQGCPPTRGQGCRREAGAGC